MQTVDYGLRGTHDRLGSDCVASCGKMVQCAIKSDTRMCVLYTPKQNTKAPIAVIKNHYECCIDEAILDMY